MNPLLLQIAMAALGQFVGAGGMTGGGMQPMTMPQRPMQQPPLEQPVRATVPSLQLSTLAAATCQMRAGTLSRPQATALLQQTGKAWGWADTWAQQIPLQRLDGAIRTAGGCSALLERIQERAESDTAMAEGFGLSPYR